MMAGEISPKPGKDSMGMDMAPVYEDAAGIRTGAIRIDPVTQQNMGLRTGPVTRGPLRHIIRTIGDFAYNEAALTDVSVKYPGWIEKLYADSTGKQIHAGDPLFEIYAPELYSAEAEYLAALGSMTSQALPGKNTMLEATLQKLRYYDVSEDQIKEIERTRQAKKAMRINSRATGVIVEKNAVEGMRAEAGERLFRIADLSTVWLLARIFEEDLPFIMPGQEAVATLSYYPDRKFRGRITYVYPSIDEKTRTAKARLEFHNPGYFLKPGMFANVEVASEINPSVLLVPDEAVLRSGEKNTVFVTLEGGRFEPREVVLGQRAEGNRYELLSGLREGETVVVSGQFLLDSESQLQEAVHKMLEPSAPVAQEKEGEGPLPAQIEPNTTHVEPTTATVQGDTGTTTINTPESVYVCPMPEHASIMYKSPGNCPICKMPLVQMEVGSTPPLKASALVIYYTCPMPEHADVRKIEPGKCPRCGMTLIPITEPRPSVIPHPSQETATSSTPRRVNPADASTTPTASPGSHTSHGL
ncbi:MAG: efflux RND transporter periplasmic adaptor subunit [Candidatus Sumerlaeota bacterium]|nr:efflux RND transporter periplasmic adaptor subunit [Candidatus Sumerlaeota bacterium]